MKVNLNTTVHHITDVIVITAPSERHRKINHRKHVGSLVAVVLDATPDAVLQQREICTDIELTVLLPRDFWITQRRRSQRHFIVGVDNREILGIHIATNTIVTIFTIRSLQLQFVNPINIEPRFLMHIPTSTK